MKIIILDTETEGLVPERHAVLELAMLAVEVPTFTVVAEFSQCVRILQIPSTIDPYVRKMHQDSGLWDDCLRSEYSLVEVENAACAFVDQHTQGDSPLGGANPGFDRGFLRAQLPLLARRFGYRNFDVRTLTLLDQWIVGAGMETTAHRALGDCHQAVRAVELHYERMAAAYGAPPARTQRDRALAAFRDRDLRTLRSVVDEAQNGPPDGAADGSISEAEWCTFRAAAYGGAK